MRIACWSGPRNISTALMRSFASRSDFAVSDEPLYAAYLADTGKTHPMREAVLASQPQDWRVVADAITGPVPGGRPHWFQKQMAHHLLPDRFAPWLADLTHVFLVRDPEEMLSSLLRAWPDADLEDTGLPQQLALAEWLATHTDQRPPRIDGRDVLDDPEGALRRLCSDLGLPWDPAMLAWPAGPHPADGAWGPHWYASLWKSTGFEPWQPRAIAIPDAKRPLLDRCRELLQALDERLKSRERGPGADSLGC